MDAMEGVGRLGGELYGEARLAKLKAYLGKEGRGITLKVGDEFVPPGYVGGFNAELGELVLRNNPTKYEVWHELAHYRQFRALGKPAYMALERPRVPEQFAFDMLENYNRRWYRLNFEEQQHAINYIQSERVGGFR